MENENATPTAKNNVGPAEEIVCIEVRAIVLHYVRSTSMHGTRNAEVYIIGAELRFHFPSGAYHARLHAHWQVPRSNNILNQSSIEGGSRTVGRGRMVGG